MEVSQHDVDYDKLFLAAEWDEELEKWVKRIGADHFLLACIFDGAVGQVCLKLGDGPF